MVVRGPGGSRASFWRSQEHKNEKEIPWQQTKKFKSPERKGIEKRLGENRRGERSRQQRGRAKCGKQIVTTQSIREGGGWGGER